MRLMRMTLPPFGTTSFCEIKLQTTASEEPPGARGMPFVWGD